MVHSNSVWVPDLTVCGDVESNPGPTWKEIQKQVMRKAGGSNAKLEAELEKFEILVMQMFPDEIVITERQVRSFLKSDDRKQIDKNVRKLVREVVIREAALAANAQTVDKIEWQAGDPVQVMRSNQQFDPGWRVVSIDDTYINVEKMGQKGNMSKQMARSKANQWLRIDVDAESAAPPPNPLESPVAARGGGGGRRPGTPPAAMPDEVMPRSADDDAKDAESQAAAKLARQNTSPYGEMPKPKEKVIKVSKMGGGRLADAWAQRIAQEQEQKMGALQDIARLKTFKKRLDDIDVGLRRKKISSALGAIQDTVGMALRGVPLRIELDTVMAIEQAHTVVRDLEQEMGLTMGRLQVEQPAVAAPSSTISVVVQHDDENHDSPSSAVVVQNINTHVVKMLRRETVVNGEAAHVVDVQEENQEPLDLVFVLDVSSSVRHDFKYLQAFVRKFIKRVLVGKKHSTRIGMVIYSREAHLVWDLADESKQDRKVMLHAVKEMKVIGGGTNTGAGIEVAMNMKGKARMKIIIVITDGQHNKGHRPWRIADQARADGWHVMAIGVRGAPNKEILKIGNNELCFQVAEYKEVFSAFEKFVDPRGIGHFMDDAPEVESTEAGDD